MSLTSDYQPAAFYFKVVFSASGGLMDTSFQEVRGISSEVETEPYQEGGENRFTHQLPKSVKSNKLVLKRGIAAMSSPLVLWCRSVFEGGFAEPITPMPMMVYLMNENKVPIRAWSFSNVFPVSWEVEAFNSTKNEVAIEKIELNYNYFTREV